MTYCCGILVEEGLVMLADTRTNAGVDNISVFRKLHVFEAPGAHALVVATAGNLSVTQSALSILASGVRDPETGAMETLAGCLTMFRAAQLCGIALRQVTESMKPGLMEAGVAYGASLLLGGQIGGGGATLYQIYGAGNFIECGPDSPFLQIGEPKYGKPILDRFVTVKMGLSDALKIALLSYDPTIRSNVAVGMPIDVAMVRRDALNLELNYRVEEGDAYFADMSQRWSRSLAEAVAAIPAPPYGQAKTTKAKQKN